MVDAAKGREEADVREHAGASFYLHAAVTEYERIAPLLLASCEAAVLYDAAIERHSALALIESWVESDELDLLYDDWIGKVRAALTAARGEVPKGD